jgi:hypothetical protein
MNLPILILLIYWTPSYLYLLIWSIRLRQKHKMTDLNKTGESLIYASTCFIGLFIVFTVKPKHIKYAILP